MLTRIMIMTLLLATACAPNPTQSSTAPAAAVEISTREPPKATSVPSPVTEYGLEDKLAQTVTKDLATRLNMEVEQISVISAQAVIWPDAALGCPLPGKVYAEGKVPGFHIQLKAQDKEYSYHTDSLGQFVLCPAGEPDIQKPPEIPVTPGEIDDGQPWMPAD